MLKCTDGFLGAQLSIDYASLVWTLPPDMARAINVMQKNVEAKEADSTSPLAHLITAAFRLPWSNLEKILTRLQSDQKAKDIVDYSWIVKMIQDELMSNPSAELASQGHTPPLVAKIEPKSVAAFPLKLSHAECYLGSSKLKTSFADSGAGALQPSSILEQVLKIMSSSPDEKNHPVRGRTALIGDAAHTIHPLAGQGLNLGLADARSLSKALIQALERGEDLGSHLSLGSYPRERYVANQAMLSAVDHLHWLFVTPPPGDSRNGFLGNVWSRAIVWSRSSGFEVLNELGSVKRALMGFAGSQNRQR